MLRAEVVLPTANPEEVLFPGLPRRAPFQLLLCNAVVVASTGPGGPSVFVFAGGAVWSVCRAGNCGITVGPSKAQVWLGRGRVLGYWWGPASL